MARRAGTPSDLQKCTTDLRERLPSCGTACLRMAPDVGAPPDLRERVPAAGARPAGALPVLRDCAREDGARPA
eukprot:7606989-Pyramimonas_sp.AAC.1